ncbi:rhodanese-like domain-containing protein [Candidatus Pandoraea novymonadis]|uniref:Rhodanese domain-containing protein n=1 Tax=Candidatus Pandoraea novymonadis TaxID=1808959 RepID=A0ABX5FEL2_9BURK|nr:rhodanese-like domain-containing protein [Candidatus Pandoraea novymonadis]PSB92135.1 hypothetical protein BZL35_00364 [Candidatus Pandoraea novymonadis]
MKKSNDNSPQKKADYHCDTKNLNYVSSITPQKALAWLQADPYTQLIDVRTRAELDWVGRPLIPKNQYFWIEWLRYPGGTPNGKFIEQLKEQTPLDIPVLFLCRSAARSEEAANAAAQAGFMNAYNVLEGFEGEKDHKGHRKSINGWCFQGLPWIGA